MDRRGLRGSARVPPVILEDDVSSPRTLQRSASSSSSESTPLLKSNVQIEVSTSLKENQSKWKSLMEIDATDNTAQQMADDMDADIEALKFFDDSEFPRTRADLSRSISLSNVMYSPVNHVDTTVIDVDKYRVAAAFIEDGIHGRKIGYRIDAHALRLVQWFHSSWYRHLFNLIGLGCCLLAFFEDGQGAMPLWWVELFCILVFSADVWVRYDMSSDVTKHKFRKREPWATLRFYLLLVTFLDMALAWGGVGFAVPRYSRTFRPFLVIARRRNVRVVFASCIRALKDVAVILALIFCVVGFFGLTGFLLFADSSTMLGVPYFSTLGDALYNMLLLQSCLPTLPALMQPYYVDNQWTSLYFILFVLFTNFFLIKLTIAVSYRTYKRNTEKMLYKRLQKRKIALSKAFDLLADDPDDPIFPRTLSVDSWLKVCKYLKPNWTAEEAEVVFFSSDVNQTRVVDFTEFIQLASIFVNAKVSKRHRQSTFVQGIKVWQRRVRNVLLAQTTVFGYPVVYMEVFVGFLICLSVVQATQVNNYALTKVLNQRWRLVGVSLLSLFTVEIVLKLFAFGQEEFFNRPFCKLDIATAAVGWIFYTITSLDPEFPIVFYDMALAVRSLRVLKLLNLFPPFHNILWTMNRIMPLIGQLSLVILSVVYAFGILAQANYGPLLASFPSSLKASATPWYAHKEVFQLDTFGNCLVTLFEEAMLAGWNSIMDAAYLITKSPNTLIFFFTFRITMSNILLPIFVGFLVESFSSNQKPAEAEEALNNATTTVLPASTMEKRVNYKMSFQRRTSDVQSAMFDFSHQKAKANHATGLDQYERKVQELNLIVQAKNMELMQLRAQVLALQEAANVSAPNSTNVQPSDTSAGEVTPPLSTVSTPPSSTASTQK
ncbi:Aste57867_18325 [Aphanomyces stellatus]|uniref:Aste57867_18325 protein n=1 Tax=Aphanomyces stellatus TaxID=120398 RepID=A0A485LBI8_9STRA|nr:hypothetical protein As57867_018263 [Aphanomyces stellatus]KAF0711095.1 hypothetical protein As57867_005381 [Aphanomyces stellatus]VFT82452.1 Aste57867_5394 [Aphanomyces stellatus]VFT95061.1 Aste57867_18325 [Aphanomyces stellatus]